MSKKRSSENRLEHIFTKALETKIKRRSFITSFLGASAATIIPVKNASAFSFEKFFQSHYKEMTPEKKKKVFTRLKVESKEKYGVDIDMSDPQPIEGVKYAYCLNLSTCTRTLAK